MHRAVSFLVLLAGCPEPGPTGATDLCMDVAQYGEAFGAEVQLDVLDVQSGFDPSVFDAVAGCLGE